MNAISFATANYVARETGWAMHGWGHGDAEANAHHRPLETFPERFDDLLARIRTLGFDAVDVWGAHLGPAWATDAHLAAAREALDGGPVVRLIASFYAAAGVHRGIELHGDAGRLFLASWAEADSRLLVSLDGGKDERVLPTRPAHRGIDWGRPLLDLRDALLEGRPHRASAEHAAHVVEILEGAARAARDGGAVELASTFEPPEPMEWAR